MYRLTAIMQQRLYIGKNHEGKTTPVQSMFRLAGNDEDALTFALGFLLAHDQDFCAKLVRRLCIAPRHTLKPDYSVHLQEITDKGFGRRDIVIKDRETRIVLEAKIGGAEPTAEQLFKYAKEKKLWRQYKRRGIVALTHVRLSAATRDEVSPKLSKKGIEFRDVQWHEVIDLALSHRPSDGSEVSRYLFEEFIRYIRRDYGMGYYDLEVQVKDVNKENACIFEKGWLYAGGYPAPLYFAPYYTWNGTPIYGMEEWDNKVDKRKGISQLARVLATERLKPSEFEGFGSEDLEKLVKRIVPHASNEQTEKWCQGHGLVQKRHDYERFRESYVWFLYLDRPIAIPKAITKQQLPKKDPNKSDSKPMTQIPPGYSLRVDELLRLGFASQRSSATPE